MSEALGEALLYLRTDDRGLDAGIAKAKQGSDRLGMSFDDTSGKATKMGGAMRGAGTEAAGASTKTGEYSREVAKLKAMLDPAWGSLQKFRQEAIVARQALDAGAISHRQYVEAMKLSAAQAGILSNAQAKATQITGAQRAGIVQLNQNFGDMATMYSLGAQPMQIFVSQIGQVTQAIQLASGGTSRFATFLGSPWLLAASTAAVVLVPLISNLLGTEDASEKAKKGALDFTDVLDYRRMSITAFRDAIDQLNKSTEKLIDLQAVSTDKLRANAQAQVADAKRRLAEVDKELAKLGDAPTGILSVIPGFGESGITSGRREALLAERRELGKALADAENAAAAAGQALIERNIDETIDKAKGVEADLNRKIAELRQRGYESRRADADPILSAELSMSGRYISREEYERQYRDLSQRLYNQRNEKSSTASTIGDATRFISPVSGGVIKGRFGENRGNRNHAGIDIAVPVGTQVKAPADGVVIEAGTVPGYGNVVYIDHGRGTISRLAHLSKIGVRKGDVVSQGNVIGLSGGARGAPGSGNSRGPHLHQEVRVNGRAVDPRGGAFQTDPASAQDKADRIAEQAARAAEEEARRTERFNRDLANLQDAALDLQALLADTAEERYRLEVEGLDVALAEHRRRIDANSDYSEAQKAELRAALAVKESFERELLDRRRREELARQSLEIAQAMNANEATLLQKQLQLADTREDRRAIDQQLLDLEYEARKRALEFRIKDPKNDRADQWAAFDELSKLEQNRSLDQRRLEREYESPIERWRRELIGYGDNLNDELEKVAVGALDSIADRLANIAFNARNAMDAIVGIFKQIGVELVALFIKQQLILPLLNMLGIGGGGGGGGFFGSLFGAGLSLLGGGGGKSGNGASAAKAAGKFAGFFADGGLIPNGSFGIVGEAGPEPVFASGGGIGVLPNSALRAMGQGNPGDTYFDLRGAVMTEDLLRQMNAMSQAHARGAVAEYDRGVGARVQENLARRG